MSAQPAYEPESPTSKEGVGERFPPHLTPVPDPVGQDPPSEEATAEPEYPVAESPSRLDGVRAWVQPPDLWSDDRPALAKVWRYARYTEQIPPTGPARVAALAYAGVAIATHAVAYTVAWVSERPARAALAAALLALMSLWPPARAVLTVVLWPLDQLIELITNN